MSLSKCTEMKNIAMEPGRADSPFLLTLVVLCHQLFKVHPGVYGPTHKEYGKY